MKNKRSVLVSGGLGFIGCHLCRRLLETDPYIGITIVDNRSSTDMHYSDLENRTEILVQDFERFNSRQKFDTIYHLASPAGSLGILKKNGYVARELLGLTYKAAEIALASDAQLVLVSSSEVYGHDGVHPETSPKVLPEKRGTRMEYALGKLLSEHVVLNLALTSRLDVKICRPFNVIGEGQSSRIGFVVPTFFEKALAGEDIPIFYEGAQRRSFCHVSDTVNGLIAVQQQGRSGQCYNLGNPDNIITVRALAEKIVALCSSSSRTVSVDPQTLFGLRYIEAFEKIPDITKARQRLFWTPQVTLEQGLARILASYRSELGGPAVPLSEPYADRKLCPSWIMQPKPLADANTNRSVRV